MPFSEEEFFEQGLNFSTSDAAKLSRITRFACIAIGGAFGTALALSTMGNTSGAQAPATLKVYSALAGLFVGGAVGATSCLTIRSKILEFINSVRQLPLASAIATLTPAKKEELRAEAKKLLDLQEKIFQLQRESESDRQVRPDLAA